jgi:hypothetical protein
MYNSVFEVALAFALVVSGVATALPAALRTDPFYTQFLDADGIPILSSARTPPEALARARAIVQGMLEKRPDIRRALIRLGERVVVMAPEEGTLDIPEQRHWKKPTRDDPRLTVCERKHYDVRIGRLSDRDYWNARARGMGGVLTSAAAENLLALPGDRYHGQNVFVHEFAHMILRAARIADPALHARVRAAYDAAMAKGLWAGEYASTTYEEYWAVGTQYWFETGRIAVFDQVRVLSPDDLRAYDPALHAVLAEVYRGHRLDGDAFWRHPARVPAGPLPKFTAEVC